MQRAADWLVAWHVPGVPIVTRCGGGVPFAPSALSLTPCLSAHRPLRRKLRRRDGAPAGRRAGEGLVSLHRVATSHTRDLAPFSALAPPPGARTLLLGSARSEVWLSAVLVRPAPCGKSQGALVYTM